MANNAALPLEVTRPASRSQFRSRGRLRAPIHVMHLHTKIVSKMEILGCVIGIWPFSTTRLKSTILFCLKFILPLGGLTILYPRRKFSAETSVRRRNSNGGHWRLISSTSGSGLITRLPPGPIMHMYPNFTRLRQFVAQLSRFNNHMQRCMQESIRKGNSTCCKIVTPENFILTLCTRDYVREITLPANFGFNRYIGSSPQMGEILSLWRFDCPFQGCL